MARAQRQGQGHAPRHRGTASPLPLSTPSHRTCTTLVLYYPCSLRLATAARVVLELHNTAAAPATIYFYWTPPTTSPCVPARYSYYAIPAPAPITTTVTTTMPIPRPRRTGWPTLWWPRGSASPIGCSTSSSALTGAANFQMRPCCLHHLGRLLGCSPSRSTSQTHSCQL